MVIELDPHKVCPFGSFCGWSRVRIDLLEIEECRGLDPNRKNKFLCELFAENYEIRESDNARDDEELS
jgi:hypothetical protein